ncbi:energy transducer TonB [Sphingomonas cannabina]|uniref:energy transducer TonB n=1 Tax=Sphingomonas cannabina TaxID=2899123 RepID=UPI001F36CC43|nr:energy transducer TonB [Sphingomonas cannabina]
MAYADRNMSGSRVVALIIVALIHVALGYAFVTGLAYQYIKKAQENLKTFEVEEPPPPPEEVPPPPPPPDQPMQPPPVVTPPPIVQTNTPPPVTITAVTTPPPTYTPAPIAAPPAPPAPPPPPPPKLAAKATPRGNPGSWFSNDDYPAGARRAGAEGRVTVSLTIGTDGKVTDCRVTSSSGNSELDATTCSLAKRRGRYKPAQDDAGNPIVSTATIPGVRWQLEE